MTRFDALLQTLSRAGVEYIVVGGVAAVIHGSVRLTRDLDVVYSRKPDNLERLVNCLAPHAPYLRGAPPGLPFQWDVETLTRGLNFTLTTDLGDLDLLGEITGGGAYEALRGHSRTVSAFGVDCLCLELDWLVRVKRAVGRPRDLEAIAELEVLREEAEGGEEE